MSLVGLKVIDSSPVENLTGSIDSLMEEEFRRWRQHTREKRSASPAPVNDHHESSSTRRYSKSPIKARSIELDENSPTSCDRKVKQPFVPVKEDTVRQRDRKNTAKTPEYVKIVSGTCWKCGLPGHTRNRCTNTSIIFCSWCGLVGVLTRNCACKSRRDPNIRRRNAGSQLARLPDPSREEQKSVRGRDDSPVRRSAFDHTKLEPEPKTDYRHRPTPLRSEETPAKRAYFEIAKVKAEPESVNRQLKVEREEPPAAFEVAKVKTTRSIGIQCDLLRTPAYQKLGAIPPEVFYVVCRQNNVV